MWLSLYILQSGATPFITFLPRISPEGYCPPPPLTRRSYNTIKQSTIVIRNNTAPSYNSPNLNLANERRKIEKQRETKRSISNDGQVQ